MKKHVKQTGNLTIRNLTKGVIIAEVLGALGAYGIYSMMNHSLDFRLKMRDNYPSVLNYYYKVGEKLGNLQTREQDSQVWNDKR